MMYLLVFIYLVLLSVFFDFLQVKGPKKFFYYLSMIILIIIAGLRWKVGGDSLTYQSRFETLIYPIDHFFSIRLSGIGWEPGYILINSIAKTIVPEFWFFQLIHASFVNVIVFKFFKRYTPYYFTAVLFYSFFYYFYFNMEILREVIPVCIFAYFMYPAMEKKEYKKYYIINILLLFFHNSSVILLLIPILSKFNLDRKGCVILIISAVAIISVFTFFPSLGSVIAITENMSAKFSVYSKYSLSINGMIYNFLIFALFPYFLFYLNKRYFIKIPFERLIFPYFFIVAIYIPYSGFGRLINYFGLFMLVFLVNTLYLAMHVNKFEKARFLIISILIIGPIFYKFQFYNTDTSKYYKDTIKGNLWYPYSSIFDKTEYQFRQIIFQEGMNESSDRVNK